MPSSPRITSPPPRVRPDNSATALVGKTLAIRNVSLPKSKDTLVLALSTGCHFCKESLPFYKKLASQAQGRVNIVALFPQPLEEAQRYVKSAALSADQVVSQNLQDLGIHATPTLLLLDDHGKVKSEWLGLLEEDRQKQVLGAAATASIHP